MSSGDTRAMTPIPSIWRIASSSLMRAEVGAGDRPTLDPELVGDRLGRDRVVAGDHPDLDPGRVRLRDGGLRGRPRRIDDADHRQQASGPSIASSRSAFGSNVAGSKSFWPVAMTRRPSVPRRSFSARAASRIWSIGTSVPSGPWADDGAGEELVRAHP